MSLLPRNRECIVVLALALCGLAGGCLSRQTHVDCIAVEKLPPRFQACRKRDMQQLSLLKLRQPAPDVYRLDTGDVLGLYIENVLGEPDASPPVHFTENGDRPPAMGFPVPIREDGTINLPYLPPIAVAGLTLTETAEVLRERYVDDEEILPEGKDRIIVTLMQPRAHRVLVVREESGGTDGVTKRGAGFTVDLDAYQNDVLHALNATGGMPGLDARNEIVVLRDSDDHRMLRSRVEASRGGFDAETLIDDPTSDTNVVRIPLRFYPGGEPTLHPDDVILQTGDIVVIEGRDSEVFYTGGLLGGGQYRLPRDQDLDILGAIALARGPVGSAGTGLSGLGAPIITTGGLPSNFGVPPSVAIVLRKLPSGAHLPIRIDLERALVDPKQRLLIQAEDVVIVRYTVGEEALNAALGLLRFNFLFNPFNN